MSSLSLRVPQSLSGSLGGKGEEQGGKFMVGDQEFDREESRRARMLYDYDAVNEDELSINSGTVCKNQWQSNLNYRVPHVHFQIHFLPKDKTLCPDVCPGFYYCALDHVLSKAPN